MLKILYLHADSGLSKEQFASNLGEIAYFSDPVKSPETLNIHAASKKLPLCAGLITLWWSTPHRCHKSTRFAAGVGLTALKIVIKCQIALPRIAKIGLADPSAAGDLPSPPDTA